MERPGLDPLVREGLHFALGKAFDDCGNYAQAFDHYRAGNEASHKRLPPYERAATEREFLRVRERFTAEWLGKVEPVSDRPLLFVCGMFRSGSTLLEQMLAAHPAVTSGGELNWFNARLARNDKRWPERVTPELLRVAGKGYLDHLENRFPGAACVCDKRPDKFLYLGLLKALFPRLRVLHTVREARDVCLSIYFQQFGNALPYAADLGDIAHYLREYRRLMQHWRELMPESILDVPTVGLSPARSTSCGWCAAFWIWIGARGCLIIAMPRRGYERPACGRCANRSTAAPSGAGATTPGSSARSAT